MGLLSVKARVLQFSIEKLEARILGIDFEEKESDSFLVWRSKSIRSEEIYDITQYDKDKCIIDLYEGNELLVKEQYQSLHERWEIAKKKEDEKREEEEMFEEESSEDVDEDDDDEKEE